MECVNKLKSQSENKNKIKTVKDKMIPLSNFKKINFYER